MTPHGPSALITADPRPPPAAASPEVAAVLRWLVDEPHTGDDGAGFMRGLAACLTTAGSRWHASASR